jgi:hypothetical protein
MALRDLAFGKYLKDPSELSAAINQSLWVTFVTCAVIFSLSFLSLSVLAKDKITFLQKLKKPGALWAVVQLSFLCGFIYLGIIFAIKQLGATLAVLIDCGVGSIAIAMLGFRKPIDKSNDKPTGNEKSNKYRFLIGLLICLLGITVLAVTLAVKNERNFKYAGILLLIFAILTPVASAYTDSLKQWLLKPENAGFTRSEILAARFLPATIIIYLIAAYRTHPLPQLEKPYFVVIIAIIGGWIPLMLLCTGLGKTSMEKLAPWEILIPTLVFTINMITDPTKWKLISLSGAVLVLLGAAISLFTKSKSDATPTKVDACPAKNP